MKACPTENLTRWRTLAGAGLLLASGLVLGACEPRQPPSGGGRPPTIVLDEVVLHHYAADGTVRVGRADEVTYDRREGRLTGRSIDVEAPESPKLRRGGVRLRAGTGVGELNGRGASVSGGVVVETGFGDRGRTAAASWNEEAQTLEGNEPVHAAGPGYELAARGFRYVLPTQQLELRGGVRIHSEPDAIRAAQDAPNARPDAREEGP